MHLHSASSSATNGSLAERFRRFFYDREAPYALALVRICLPIALLCAMLPRWFRARELFSLDGASTPLWIGYGWPDLLPEIPGTLAVVFASVLILTLITTSLGWCTRASVLISFVLYTYLNLLDAVSTMTKYSVIASHVLLLLGLSQCGAVWSIDSWRKRRGAADRNAALPGESVPRFPAWPRRLIQLLMGYVYFGAAMTKLHTPAYFSSDQLLTWLLSNVNYANPLGEYLSLFPAALVLFAYVTIVWEILFVFLCWRGWGRRFMLGLGIAFHVMTTLTLGLYIFPMVCLSTYFAFLKEDDVRRCALSWRHVKRRLFGRLRRRSAHRAVRPVPAWMESIPLSAPLAFAVLLALAALAGVEAEYRLDPYGKRRPAGPYPLKEVDAEFVEAVLMSPPQAVRYKDMIWDFTTGTTLVSGIVAFPRKEFRQGETITAQCTLNTPHKDMIMECTLDDADGHVVVSRRQPVTREMLRLSFFFPITAELEPGRYSLQLKCAGVPVNRRSIIIQPGRGRESAN